MQYLIDRARLNHTLVQVNRGFKILIKVQIFSM